MFKRLKKLIISIMILVFFSTSQGFAAFDTEDNTNYLLYTIKEVESEIKINDKPIKLDSNPITFMDSIYVPIRSFADALGASNVTWEKENNSIIVNHNNISLTAYQDSKFILVNGYNLRLKNKVIFYNNKTYVPINSFGSVFGADKIEVDDSNKVVNITKDNYDVPKEFIKYNYTDEDVYWLSRIVNAEAKGEPFEGKVAVANVVINRKKSYQFPNSIKEVIFDTKSGVQFTPIKLGTIYNTPSEECIQAAREALEGNNNIGESLYFIPLKSTNSWVARNRTFYMQIKGHLFYL
ncbi:MAG: cell wall hydrolase [Eubacteriales bacterium]